MTTTNQHTFHHQRLLQNARALHPGYYAQMSNQFCINKRIMAPTGDRLPMKAPTSRLNLTPETTLLHSPDFRPDSETALQPEFIVSVAITSKSRMVWKPGHGIIEKVDKLTGEIMHLAEEFMDKNNKMRLQAIY